MSTHKSTARKRADKVVLVDPESLVRFAELLKLRSLAGSTQVGYLRVLRRLCARAGGDIAGLDEAQVRAHVLHLKEHRAYSPSSIRTAVAALRAYYGLHLGREWICRWGQPVAGCKGQQSGSSPPGDHPQIGAVGVWSNEDLGGLLPAWHGDFASSFPPCSGRPRAPLIAGSLRSSGWTGRPQSVPPSAGSAANRTGPAHQNQRPSSGPPASSGPTIEFSLQPATG
jgi:hypothetical protein